MYNFLQFSIRKGNLFNCLLLSYLFLPLILYCSLASDTLYLTWKDDPTTTMTVQWLTPRGMNQNILNFKPLGQGEWKEITSASQSLPSSTDYLIHQVHLTNLNPDSEYSIKLQDFQEYKFHTMPATLQSPLNFVVGGDMYHDAIEFMNETSREAAKQNPSFVLVGGDIAYSINTVVQKAPKIDRWIEWLKSWHKDMVTPDGKLIPVLAAIGNHDLVGQYKQSLLQANLFKALFPGTSPNTYFSIQFGNYLTLFVLDSGHATPVNGEQADWLKKSLNAHSSTRHRFALYHVPAYPSIRSFTDSRSTIIRRSWVPLFEAGGMDIAFENHDHAYKRTFPLIKDKKNPNGVLYVGDGAWGIEYPRHPRRYRRPLYLSKSASVRHFLLVTINGDQERVQAINNQGRQFDDVSQLNRRTRLINQQNLLPQIQPQNH